MAIPITDPYRRVQPNVLEAVQIGLTQQLAREKMMIDDARARQLAAQQERDNERRHQQQMSMFGLNEMKFNYEKQQDINRAEQDAVKARTDQIRRDQEMGLKRDNYNLAKDRLYNPPAARPRALTAAQVAQNQSDYANGRPLTYPNPTAGAVAPSDPYAPSVDSPYGSDVSSPDAPGLAALQDSLNAGMNGGPMPGEGSYGYGPPSYDASSDLPTGGGANSGDLLDPSIVPAPNPAAPPVSAPENSVLPPPYMPRNDPGSLLILEKERALREKNASDEVARLTTAAAAASKAAEEATPEQKDTLKRSAEILAAQLEQKQNELRNIIQPPAPPRDETQGIALDPTKNVNGQSIAIDSQQQTEEPKSFAEIQKDRANAGIYKEWDTFKAFVTADIPRAFSEKELPSVLKSIEKGEEDELAAELADRGSSLVEEGQGAPAMGSGIGPYGAVYSGGKKKPVFKKFKAPNGEMMSGFEVLKMIANEAKPKSDQPKPPSEKATTLTQSWEK